MGIEGLVYECCKVGIKGDLSGGQIFSYTRGMDNLLSEPELNLSKLCNYEQPNEPMSYTYRQMETLFPKQFRYEPFDYHKGRLFAFSNNRISLDWAAYSDYNDYLNIRKDGNVIVPGRTGSHGFYILAGDMAKMKEFPCMYYQSESLKMPYTEQDFCSSKRPDYMEPLEEIYAGSVITQENVRDFLSEKWERMDYLKEMAYCLLHYKAAENGGYNKNLVICCEKHEEVIYWISALTFLFSRELAAELSFSTYEYCPIGADYRICGAFPVGTEYESGRSYRESFVFDFCEEKKEEFEEIKNGNKSELYTFLVNSFLYAPEALEEFYGFLSNFDFHEASEELEHAFELYSFFYLDRSKQSMDCGAFKIGMDFMKYCKNHALLKELLVKAVNFYAAMPAQEKQECQGTMVGMLSHFSECLEELERLYAQKLAAVTAPSSKVSAEAVQAAFTIYRLLFEEAGGNFISACYQALRSRAGELLENNGNIPFNLYHVRIIYQYMEAARVDISHISPRYEEGKMLHAVVGNILRKNLSGLQLEKCIRAMTETYQGNTYKYLYVILELEGMARDFPGSCAEEWVKISDSYIEHYMDSAKKSAVMKIYGVLAELGYEDKVLRHIEKRSRTDEDFELLFEDVRSLLGNYGRQIWKYQKWLCETLIQAAQNKRNACKNLVMVLNLRSGKNDDKIFFPVACKIVQYMDMQAESVDLPLLDTLVEVYEQNGMKIDPKLTAVYILKEIEEDLKTGRKHIVSKYGKLPLKPEQLELPEVSEAALGQFFDSYGRNTAELYVISGNIKIIHYFNHLFRIREIELKALAELQLRVLAGMKKADTESFAKLLAYAVVSENAPDRRQMAEILNSGKQNINKIDKYFHEKEDDLWKSLQAELKLRSVPKEGRRYLLEYWDEVYELTQEDDKGIMKKIVKSFWKK